ncbi:hypothetical protein GGI15_003113 [Coemansia interrupta]|uniref:Uncharacterized protein n=1 Tax=Coemansia interrupta TaxID=1126814 RepID=A0A9W8HG35_9FUNG|nr:hypothetical protein GGI15_003113 [Coemansia interrupta]
MPIVSPAYVLPVEVESDHIRTKRALECHYKAEQTLLKVTEESYAAYERARQTYEQEIQAAKDKMAAAEREIGEAIWKAMIDKENATAAASKELNHIKQTVLSKYPFLEDLGIKLDMPSHYHRDHLASGNSGGYAGGNNSNNVSNSNGGRGRGRGRGQETGGRGGRGRGRDAVGGGHSGGGGPEHGKSGRFVPVKATLPTPASTTPWCAMYVAPSSARPEVSLTGEKIPGPFSPPLRPTTFEAMSHKPQDVLRKQNEEFAMKQRVQQLLQQAKTSPSGSLGNFVGKISHYNNNIIPVLPRPDTV